MTDHQRTLDALFAAILRDPGDDVVRLLWADEYEAIDPDRADFVRVQVELSRRRDEYDSYDLMERGPTYKALRRREGELWLDSSDHRPQRWVAIPGWAASCPADQIEVEYHPPTGRPFVCAIRRGFVDEITLRAADFLGGVCKAGCWPLSGVHVVSEDGRRNSTAPCKRCSACHGKGRTPGHAAALFASAPITRVVLTTWPEAPDRFGRPTLDQLRERWPGVTFILPAPLSPPGAL